MQIHWCSFCHRVALMEAGEWLPDAAQAGGPGPRGRWGPTLPSSLLRNWQSCSTVPVEGSPSGIWEPEGEKGLSSSALLLPHPHRSPPRAHTAQGPQHDPRPPGHLTQQGGDGGDVEAEGRAAREKGALPSESQGSKL